MVRWLKYFFLGTFTGLLGVIVYLSPAGLWLEERVGLSTLFLLRGAIQAPADVVVIAIDQPSANQLNLSIKPRLWPRSLHAQLITQLAAAGASAIIFDLIFDTASGIPEQDEALANAIAPGFIETDMTNELKPELREGVLKQIPLGVFGQAEDIAGGALYLAAASGRYVTGQVLTIDGGMVM